MNFQEVYKYTQDLSILYVEDDINLLNETKDALEDFFSTLLILLYMVGKLLRSLRIKFKIIFLFMI